jgi:hypothetical protein
MEVNTTYIANEIEKYFLFYGFLKCPFNRKKLVSLILRGFDKDKIYEFGCDIATKSNGERNGG